MAKKLAAVFLAAVIMFAAAAPVFAEICDRIAELGNLS